MFPIKFLITLIYLILEFYSASVILAEDDFLSVGDEIINDSESNDANLNPLKDTNDLMAVDEVSMKPYSSAKIVAINKITAQSKEMIFKIGESKYFGNVEIKIYKCYKALDPYAPDNKILLSVIEEKVDEEPNIIFQGWMMSSNISISTFVHPVYEILAKDCF